MIDLKNNTFNHDADKRKLRYPVSLFQPLIWFLLQSFILYSIIRVCIRTPEFQRGNARPEPEHLAK